MQEQSGVAVDGTWFDGLLNLGTSYLEYKGEKRSQNPASGNPAYHANTQPMGPAAIDAAGNTIAVPANQSSIHPYLMYGGLAFLALLFIVIIAKVL